MALTFHNMFADWVYKTDEWMNISGDLSNGNTEEFPLVIKQLSQDDLVAFAVQIARSDGTKRDPWSELYHKINRNKTRRGKRTAETGKYEVLDASQAFDKTFGGMEKHLTKYLKGYPNKTGPWKFDNADDCLVAFRKAIKDGLPAGGITCQKVRKYLRWEVRKIGALVVSKSKADSTCTWVPECLEEYKADCEGVVQSVAEEEPEFEAESEDEDPEPEVEEAPVVAHEQDMGNFFEEDEDDSDDEETMDAKEIRIWNAETHSIVDAYLVVSEGEYKNKILDAESHELHETFDEWEWDEANNKECPGFQERLVYIGEMKDHPKYWYIESGDKSESVEFFDLQEEMSQLSKVESKESIEVERKYEYPDNEMVYACMYKIANLDTEKAKSKDKAVLDSLVEDVNVVKAEMEEILKILNDAMDEDEPGTSRYDGEQYSGLTEEGIDYFGYELTAKCLEIHSIKMSALE